MNTATQTNGTEAARDLAFVREGDHFVILDPITGDVPEGEPEDRRVVEIEGMLYCEETGECLGAVNQEFRITTEDDANWVLKKRFELDAEILATKAQIDALTANLKTKLNRLTSRLNGLDFRFKTELQEFAALQIVKQNKGSSWVSPYGTLAFRSAGASVKVADQEAAIKWAREYGQKDAIKVTEEFQISKVPAEERKKLIALFQLGEEKAMGTEPELFTHIKGAFEFVPPSESFSIKSGVGG